jgi:hypothetical protein
MKKNRTIIIAVIIIGLAFTAGLGWRWVQGTPYYALYQIGKGLKNRDLNTVLAYVDLESVLNQQVSGPVSRLLSSMASSSLGKITGPGAEIKIQLSPGLTKGLSNIVVEQFKAYLENPRNPTLPSSFVLLGLADFKIKEDAALVTLQHEKERLRMGMRKQEGFWRVVELNQEDMERLIKTYLLRPSK